MGPDIESLGLTELFFRFAVRDKLKIKQKTFFIQFQNYKSYFSYFLPIPCFLLSEPPLLLDTLYY